MNHNDSTPLKRHATRAPLERQARLQFENDADVIEGQCRNISIGGMFVVAEPSGQQPGQNVRFELIVDTGLTIRGLAELMWMRESWSGLAPGFGLKFKFLEQRDRQAIFKLVSSHIKDRLSSRYPAAEPDPVPDAESLIVPPVVSSQAAPPSLMTPVEPVAPPVESIEPDVSIPDVPPSAAPSPAVSADPPPVVTAASGPPPRSPVETTLPPVPTVGGEVGQASFLDDVEPMEFTPARKAASVAPPSIAPGPPPAAPTVTPRAAAPSSLSDMFIAGDDGSLDLPMGSDSGRASAPAVERAAAVASGPTDLGEPDDPYLQHLGPDHFEHRPAPRRDLPVLPLAAVVMIAAASLVYLFSDQLFDRLHGEEAPPTTPTGLASTDTAGGATPSTEAPADPRPGDAGTAAVPSPGSDPATGSNPAAEPADASTGAPPPVAAPVRDPFTRITDITWATEGTDVVLTLTTDGNVERRRLDQFRLEKESIREVVRLLGVKRPFQRPTLHVGSGGVEKVRFGWHRKRGGGEVHLVLDISDPQSQVRDMSIDGRKIRIRIGRG